MRWKLVALLLAVLLFGSWGLAQAETSAYEKLSDSEKKIIDTVLDEFKKNHMIFLEELGEDLYTLHACAGIPEVHDGPSGKEHHHDNDTDYKDEHLAVRAYKATPDSSGKYLTPTFTGPDKTGGLSTFTYKEIHTVAIKDKKLTVSMTRVEEGKPERIKEKPNSKFVESLASRLQGKLGEDGVILLPGGDK